MDILKEIHCFPINSIDTGLWPHPCKGRSHSPILGSKTHRITNTITLLSIDK